MTAERRGVALEHRDVWRRLSERLLGGREPELLKVMTRFCPGCGEWVEFEYFEAPERSGRLWGRCRSCPYLVRRYAKTYIKNMLHNPIHAEEEVLFESPRFQELAKDREIDVGYEPCLDPFGHLHEARGRRVVREAKARASASEVRAADEGS